MFGSPCYLAADSLFAFLVTGGVVLTCLPEENQPELDKMFAFKPFTSKGRKIGRWVEVAVEGESDIERLIPFLKLSYDAALAK